MPQFILSFLKRFKALGDKSALTLILPAIAALFCIDDAMARTIAQWLVVTPIIAGVSVVVSRIIFPHIDLSRLIDETHEGNQASSILAGSLLIFVGILVFAVVTWAKA